MNQDDNKPQVVLSSAAKIRKSKYLKFDILALAFILVVIIIFAFHSYLQKRHETKSQKLISQITLFEKGKIGCTQGMKQLSPAIPNISKTGVYTIPAREDALSYLVRCSFQSGKPQQSLTYASQLSVLYKQDGPKSAKQLQYLNDYVAYINSYTKQQTLTLPDGKTISR